MGVILVVGQIFVRRRVECAVLRDGLQLGGVDHVDHVLDARARRATLRAYEGPRVELVTVDRGVGVI